MLRAEREGDEDDNNVNNRQLQSSKSTFGIFLQWAPAAIAVAAGAGLAYKAAKKQTLIEVDEGDFHKYFERYSQARREDKESLDYIVKCLSHSDICCNKLNPNGYAPLHLASKEGNITAVQAILPFHPNLQLKSGCGKTPLELIQVAKSSEKDTQRLTQLNVIEYILSAVDDTSSSTAATWPIEPTLPTHDQFQRYNITEQNFIHYVPDVLDIPKSRNPKIRALCIDGGGTRGFVPLEFLEFIEHWSPFPEPLEQHLSIKRHFDYIAGTSTGGIIALYLALGHTVDECRRLYFILKDKIFCGSKPYNAEKYEMELKSAFGEKKMMDITGIKVVITTTTGTAERLISILYTNYDERTSDEFIWKVARMTSAAPYFFNPYKHSDGKNYYDGGLTANNPTQALISEISRLKGNLNNGIIVSLGTGKAPLTGNLDLNFSNRMGIMNVLGIGLKTLINQVCQSDGECINYAKTTCSLAHCSYYRLTPTLPEDIVLDETDNEKLLNMIYHTKAYIKLYKSNIIEMCQRLMAVTEESGLCSIV